MSQLTGAGDAFCAGQDIKLYFRGGDAAVLAGALIGAFNGWLVTRIGIPSFVLALAPSDGPLYRGRLIRALAAFAVPAGLATALGTILSFFLVDTVFGGSLEAGRTAATTTLIVLGLAFVLLLERGPGREHIAIQSYMLALVAGLGALYALILAAAPVRDFFEMTLLTASQWFLALFCSAIGLTIASLLWRLPQIERLEAPGYEPVAGDE